MDKTRVDVQQIKREWSSFWRRAYKFTRCRVSRLFFFVTTCCAIVTALIWYFALFDDLQVRILMSLVIAWIPMTDFQPPPRTWTSREYLLGLSSLVALAVLLVAGDKFESASVVLNAGVLLVALPYGWLVWKLMRRNGLLLTGVDTGAGRDDDLLDGGIGQGRRLAECAALAYACGAFLRSCLDTGGGAGIGHCRTMEEP